MSIPSHILEQLNSQADLVGLIGKYTTLKRSGGTYRGKCPFHKGNSLSFSVNPQKNLYHCFKCHASGNAFSFLKDYENLTFMEAVDELSRQTGIEVPKEDKKELRYKRRPIAPQPSPSNQPLSTKTVPTASSDTHHKTKPNSVQSSASNSSSRSKISQKIDSQTNKQVSNPNVAFADTSTQSISTTLAESNFQNNSFNHDFDQGADYNDYYNNATLYADSPNSDPIDDSSINWDDYYGNLASNSSYVDQSGYVDNSGYTGHGNHSNQSSNTSSIPSSRRSSKPPSQTITQEGNLYDLLTAICQFYQTNLANNPQAMRYFKERGLSDETIQEFNLGYAPAGWQHLEQAFAQDVEGLKALGLIRNSAKGRDYNLLRDRVIFPIKDNQGRIIGFAGRALDNEVKPKYINSSDSPVFHKQYVLYGYYESRQKRADDWLVVEGYMDVIALHQAGIYGAVASMGTSINESQIARLLQMNPVLTLCFDGDDAGQKAAWRTLEVALPILSDDKELRFLTLPGGHDPDTYIAANGVDAMREQIKHALPLSQYVFAYLSERYDLSMAEGKAKLMAQVRELTNKLPKGSSFKYLLNNDIFQKVNGKKRFKKTTAHDALLDFDSGMTSLDQLELCLLFNPHILSEDPISRLWEESGVANIKLPPSRQNDVTLPNLPSWQDFNSANLIDLVKVITPLLSYLPEDTNAAAHFILANLPNKMQQELSERWHSFWSNLNEREIIEIKELTDELLIHLMLAALKNQMLQSRNIVTISLINKQRQTLSNWHKKQQAEQANKMS